MIRSMTGYGKSELADNGSHVLVEVWSVNHRYLDLSVRLPKPIAAIESEIRRFVQERVDRGKISVTVTWESGKGRGGRLRLDEQRLEDYLSILTQIRQRHRLSGELDLGALLTLPDIVTEEEDAADLEAWWGLLQPGLAQAIDGMLALKSREGQEMAKDMLARIDRVEEILGEIETRSPVRVEEGRDRMRQRISQLLEGNELDPYRLEQEIVFLAERMDCTEECVRLRSHLKQFREFAKDQSAAGRKLNFLLQEMHREANTIGSKASDSEIAHRVVLMKDELERVREQVQNVE